MGRVTASGETVTINGVPYNKVLTIMDVDPYDGCEEEERKLYAPGVGEIADEHLEIVEYKQPELCYEPTISADVCDPDKVTFTLDSNNPYYSVYFF